MAAEERLNAMAQEVLTAASPELYLSVAGAWEIAIKAQIGNAVYDKRKFALAHDLFAKITTDDEFAEFLTLPAYDCLD